MKHMCSLCGIANDPLYYAMEQLKGKWYHKICIRAAANFAINQGFKVKWKPKHD